VKRPILFGVLMMLTTGALAGGTRRPALSDQPSAKQGITASTTVAPNREITLLYPRLGTWDVTIRTEPAADSPHTGLDKGVATISKGPGGLSIVQKFWSRGTSGFIKGQSYTWWDGPTSTYKSVWCDNTQGCTEFTTAISGRSWTTELDGEADGKKVHTIIRATMSENLSTIREEVTSSSDGGPLKLESVSEYIRVPAAGRQKARS
jgi:hypothetical protein